MKHIIWLLLISSLLFGQIEEPIDDFYEYANSEWLQNTTIPDGGFVVNNWGMLWDNIIDKSIEILSQETDYELDEDYQFVLIQLQNLYNSSSVKFADERKRVELVQEKFPTLFGILFSEITYSVDEKNRINELIKYLKSAYRIKITDSNRIGDKYKQLFLSKLDKMDYIVGAPNLSNLPKMPLMDSVDLDKNLQLANEYRSKIEGNQANWKIPPFEIYCAYNFYENAVKIHAGMLFDAELEKEDNYTYLYATFGRTIAHEMTHAFDNMGRNFDSDGKRINKLFSGLIFDKNEWERIYTDITEQYNEYTIQDSLNVDGEATLQENIADIGGVEVSLLALKLVLTDKNYSEEDSNNFIKDYFIDYAQYWREIGTDGFERMTLERAHTPQKYRAIGPIINQNDFYDLYNIKVQSDFYISPEKRVTIW